MRQKERGIEMVKYRNQYRINKKGCEFMRFDSYEEARAKLDELQAKRPGVYTMQERHCRLGRYGVLEIGWNGENAWSSWS